MKKSKKRSKTIGLIISVCILGFLYLCFFNSSVIENTISRIFINGSVASSGAVDARLGTFVELFERDFVKIIFGTGYGSVLYENAWMSGITYVLCGTGIIGLLLIVSTIGFSYLRSREMSIKVVCIAFSFLFLTDDAFNSYMIVLYMSLMLYSRYYVEKQRRDVKE